MSTSSLKESFELIVTQASRITHELNRALDSYENMLDNATAQEQVLELGALLANVRRGRAEAFELMGHVPSPNSVPAYLAEEVACVTRALFKFIDTCDHREAVINRMATGWQRKVAV